MYETSQEIFLPADKTNELYKITPENYKKLLRNNITSKYEKTNEITILQLNLNWMIA